MPFPDRGALVISLDFELYWGMRDCQTVENYGANIRGVHQLIPRLLELFERRRIHATWATVGLLTFRNRAELRSHLDIVRPNYENPGLCPYRYIVETLTGEDASSDPLHFGADLVELIAQTPGQELGSHTFSHYYTLESHIDSAALAADLEASRAALSPWTDQVRSIVFPRNQYDDTVLDVAKDAGLTIYRGNENHWAYWPKAWSEQTRAQRLFRLLDTYVNLSGHHLEDWPRPSANGTVNVPASRFLRPYNARLAAFDPLKLRRITRGLESAASEKKIYHLWWHPHNMGINISENLQFLDRILDKFEELSETHGLISSNMGEIADLVAQTDP